MSFTNIYLFQFFDIDDGMVAAEVLLKKLQGDDLYHSLHYGRYEYSKPHVCVSDLRSQSPAGARP